MTNNAYVSGVGLTAFGRLPGLDALGWQLAAAQAAMADAGLGPQDIDGVMSGYALTHPHLMPANLSSELLGIQPQVCFGMSVGGATGLAMVAEAVRMLQTSDLEAVLVLAGEDRASGQSRQQSTDSLAQVGHPRYEVPLGGTVPAYYALLASQYLWRYGLGQDALSSLPVQMRRHATTKEGAHFVKAISETDVQQSRPVSDPLRLLDCCPVSDGGAAFVLTRQSLGPRSIQVLGTGAANRHQHLSALRFGQTGAREAAERALGRAALGMDDIDVFGIYDSFSITIAMLLEELGIAPEGGAGGLARSGELDRDGKVPLNTHGGLLSYGHSGVSGGMAHLAEVVTQLRSERRGNQVQGCERGYVHADGGVLSAHVAVVLGVQE